MLKMHTLPLSAVVRETAEAVTLVMDQPLVDRVAYHAGQYLTFRFEAEGAVHYRTYSLSSAPRLDRHLAVTVKAVPGGEISSRLVAEAQPGDLMTFMQPAGRFFIETATKHRRHLWLWGAGSGITPLMSMLRAVLYLEPYSRVSLVYQNRREADVIFRAQLADLTARFAGRFQLWHYLSQPEPGPTLPHRPGRLGAAAVPDLLASGGSDLPQAHFLCGPAGFRAAVRQGLTAAGVAPDAIAEEAFVADAALEARQRDLSGPTRQVRLTLGGRAYTVQVPPGTTILEAGLQQGVPLPYSCKQGTCSTCMGQCLSGQVGMESPDALLDFEIARGKVLVCQARPESDDVHIRVG